ncbi:hypothetical protein JCM5350_001205 [Sporobolomyces pararoseus]
MSSSPLLPPSSSPSSPFPPSPFSRLPNELVQTIIESSAPHHYHSESYASRQSTLYSLCLVSKLFHQIAKPLLYAVMEVTSFTPEGKWHDSSKDGLRSLVCDFNDWTDVKSEDFDSLVRFGSQLRRLTLSANLGTVDMYTLSHSKNLVYLQLHRVTVSASSSFKLEAVTALEFFSVRWAKPTSEIVNSTTLPALSALSFVFQAELSMKEVFQSVGSQIHAIFADWLGFPEDQVRQVQEKTLFDVHFRPGDPLPSVRYLRLYGEVAASPSIFEELLDSLRQFSNKARPSLIYLPSNPNFDLSPQNKVYVELKSECEKVSVELVFEEQPRNWRLDSAISHDFWARMRTADREKRFT